MQRGGLRGISTYYELSTCNGSHLLQLFLSMSTIVIEARLSHTSHRVLHVVTGQPSSDMGLGCAGGHPSERL